MPSVWNPVAHEYYVSFKAGLRCKSRFYAGDFADTLADLLDEGFRTTHIYMDLGVSSMQIDTPERGFSYSYDAPLDMRMDPASPVTAADIVTPGRRGSWPACSQNYGEERYSGRIARDRGQTGTESPHPTPSGGHHKRGIPPGPFFGPATGKAGPSQALRIEVNASSTTCAGLPEAFRAPWSRGVHGGHQLPFAGRPHGQGVLWASPGVPCPPGVPVCVCGAKGRRQRS